MASKLTKNIGSLLGQAKLLWWNGRLPNYWILCNKEKGRTVGLEASFVCLFVFTIHPYQSELDPDCNRIVKKCWLYQRLRCLAYSPKSITRNKIYRWLRKVSENFSVDCSVTEYNIFVTSYFEYWVKLIQVKTALTFELLDLRVLMKWSKSNIGYTGNKWAVSVNLYPTVRLLPCHSRLLYKCTLRL